MYCNNCGKALNPNDEFCGNCGEKVIVNSTMNNNTIPSILCIVSLIPFFGSIIITGSLEYLLPSLKEYIGYLYIILPIVGLLLPIYCRIKYPNYSFSKVLIGFYAIIIILIALFAALIFIIGSGLSGLT